ncbi:MAG: pyruvate ferredoxin oxidoreductase [Deltaproteobacteria bacterium]|jgi:indolepyruvate ferredoxin oxidoreductase beta subunit|nr:pyruvate ferredoxin oxidoreductase [Deltaproteobacteria bacterium]
MTDEPFRILVVGVGGQGVLVATKVLGDAAMSAGQTVHVGQIHGMSQRGGSVESTVVIGAAHTSFVGPAQANVVLGLEPVETRRALSRMSTNTDVAMSTSPVALPSMSVRGESYPDVSGITDEIRRVARGVIALDATALALSAGDARCQNVVMLGVLDGLALLPFDHDALAMAVDQQSPERFVETNRRALDLGRQRGKQFRQQTGEERCLQP